MTNKILAAPFIVTLLLLASGCGSIQVNEGKTITSVDLRALQTREFDAERKVVMQSVIEMFQDLGLGINEINDEYGIISTKEGPLNFSPKKETSVVVFGKNIPVTDNTSELGQGTANIEEIAQGRVRVRVNFNKISSTVTSETKEEEASLLGVLFGGDSETTTTTRESNVIAVTDEQFYRVVFEKIEKSIFLRENQ